MTSLGLHSDYDERELSEQVPYKMRSRLEQVLPSADVIVGIGIAFVLLTAAVFLPLLT